MFYLSNIAKIKRKQCHVFNLYLKHIIMLSVCTVCVCIFRSLFQNSPAVKNDVFQLSIQDVGGIGQILDYMYTSHLELNPDNAHTLLHIAQNLQVLQVIGVGCVPNCMNIWI